MKAQGDTWESAMASKGRTADRSRYRVCRDVFIADTDAEAKRMVLKTGMMRTWHEYLKEIYVKFGLFDGIIADSGQDISPADIDDDFLRSEEHTSELPSLMRITYAVFFL